MASYFEELGLNDRPFLDTTVKIGSKEAPVRVRNISAEETDTIDAKEMKEFNRLSLEAQERPEGGKSEWDRVLGIYKSRPIHEVAEQLLATRQPDILKYATEMAGLDPGAVALELDSIDEKDAEARKKFTEETDKKINVYAEAAKKKVIDEIIASAPAETLCERLTEININFKCQVGARTASNVDFLLYTLYRPAVDGEPDRKVFDNAEQIRSLTSDTITSLSRKVREVLQGASDPLPSQDGPDSDKPSTSSSNSEADPKPSEPSTEAAPAS